MTDNKKFFIKTADGSSTLFSQEYGEAMHSDSGAYEEALLKHIYPSKILESSRDPLNVLDIGFGLGYNILALVSEAKNRNLKKNINIISLEKERELLPFMEEIFFNDYRDEIYFFIKQAYSQGFIKEDGFSIKILFGDGRESLDKIKGISFDAIFQDPYSPSKNPEMWSLHYFKRLFTLLDDTGILTTYSSALHVRRAMLEAGFIIGKGPSVGKKREGTLAGKNPLFEPLSQVEIEEIFSSSKSEVYLDPDFTFSRESILANRRERVRLRRI